MPKLSLPEHRQRPKLPPIGRPPQPDRAALTLMVRESTGTWPSIRLLAASSPWAYAHAYEMARRAA